MPRNTLLGAPGFEEQSSRVGSVLAGRGSGGGSGLDLSALLTPPESASMNPLSVGVGYPGGPALDMQTKAEKVNTPPIGILPTELTDREKRDAGGRFDQILKAAPGVDPATAMSLAFNKGLDLDDAFRQARAKVVAKPTSWWMSGYSPVKWLKSTFVDAPEWLWKHTVADTFQELGELTGIQSDLAQHMSPGQIIQAQLAVLTGAESFVREDDGAYKDPSQWNHTLRWGAGGLDLGLRLNADPTLVLGKFRALRALPLGAEKLFGIQRVESVAGASVRVSRLRAMDVGKAERIVGDILDGNKAIRRFVFGDTSLPEFARAVVRSPRAKSLINDVVALHGEPEAVSELLKNYGTLRRGIAPTAEHIAYLVDAAQSGSTHAGRMAATKAALSDLILGNVSESTAKRLSAKVAEQRHLVGIRHDAVRRWEHAWTTKTPYAVNIGEDLRSYTIKGERVGQMAGQVMEPVMGNAHTNINSFGRALLSGDPELMSQLENLDSGGWAALQDFLAKPTREGAMDVARSMDEIEMGLPEGSFPGGRERMTPDIRNVKADPRSMEQIELGMPEGAGREGFRIQPGTDYEKIQHATDSIEGIDDELRSLGDALKPYLGVHSMDDVEIEAIARGFRDISAEMRVTNLLGEFPRKSMEWAEVPILGNTMIRKVPEAVNRALEYLPHATVDLRDPHWNSQITRYGRAAKLPEDRITSYIEAIRLAKSKPEAAGIVNRMVDETATHIGLNAEQLKEVRAAVAARNGNIFAALPGGKIAESPFYAAQEVNIVEMTDPRKMKAFLRRAEAGFVGMPAYAAKDAFVGAADAVNNAFKRLMVMNPRTGLRILLEGQTRAASYGMSSMLTDPRGLLPLMMAEFSPSKAAALGRKLSPENISRIALQSDQLGMAAGLHEAGLMSRHNFQAMQVLEWGKMTTPLKRSAYRKMQAEFINDFMLNDDFVRRVLHGTPEEALRWAADPTDIAARQWRAKLQLADGAAGAKRGDEMVAHMNHMNLKGDMAEAAGSRRLTADDIVGKEAPTVAGGDYTEMESASLAKRADKVLNYLVQRNLASVEYVGRDFTTRRELYRELSARVGRMEAKGHAVNWDVLDHLLAGGTIEGGTHSLEFSMFRSARRDVYDRVKFLFFDTAERSRAADAMRFVFPFGNAYQEMTSVWSSVLRERPWLPHIANTMWGASDDVPGVTYNDPATGEKMFRIPLVNHLLRFAGLRGGDPLTGIPDGSGWEFVGKLKGFNVVASGLPMPGPFMQSAANLLSDTKLSTNDVFKVFFPFGTGGSFIEKVSPKWLNEARASVSAYMGSEESNQDLHGAAATLLMEELYKRTKQVNELLKQGKTQEAQEMAESLDDIDADDFHSTLGHLFALKTLARIAMPAAIQERSPYANMLSFYRKMQSVDPAMADAVFLARYGPEFQTLIEQRTKMVDGRGHAPPTLEAKKMLLTDPDFARMADQFGPVAWAVFGEAAAGDLDPDALKRQMSTGIRKRVPLKEMKENSLAAVGWSY
ncbi:MAG: hypothetical protein ABIW84_03690, partial [Ilumatobacteraceae bacterium]